MSQPIRHADLTPQEKRALLRQLLEKKAHTTETSRVFTPHQLILPEVAADPYYPVYRQLRDQSPFSYVVIPAGIFAGIDQPLRA